MSNMDPKRVVTGRVRLSYAHLTKPRAAKPGDELKYSVTLLIPKSDVATRQRIDAAIAASIQEGIASRWNGQRPAQPAVPIYDGDGLRPTGERFNDECRGHWVMTASSKDKPQVVDINLNEIINVTEIYSGMYAHVSVRFFAYFNSGKKGIGCGLGNVQKVADGEPLAGSSASAADDFGGNAGGYAPAAPAYYQQPAQPQYAPPAAPAYPQQPAAPVYPPQQAGYAQPSYAPQAPAYPQQPTYAPQAQPQYTPPAYPQQPVQIDPVTGRPITGGVMGL